MTKYITQTLPDADEESKSIVRDWNAGKRWSREQYKKREDYLCAQRDLLEQGSPHVVFRSNFLDKDYVTEYSYPNGFSFRNRDVFPLVFYEGGDWVYRPSSVAPLRLVFEPYDYCYRMPTNAYDSWKSLICWFRETLDQGDQDFISALTKIKDEQINEYSSRYYDDVRRVTQEYDLCLMSAELEMKKNTLYVKKHGKDLEYTVIAPNGRVITWDNIISNAEFKEATGQDIPESLNIDSLKLFLPKIVHITSKRFHTYKMDMVQRVECVYERKKNKIDYMIYFINNYLLTHCRFSPVSYREPGVYVVKTFHLAQCQHIRGHAVVLTNENTAYFVVDGQILMENNQPKCVRDVDRGDTTPMAETDDPKLCMLSLDDRRKLVNRALLKAGYKESQLFPWKYLERPLFSVPAKNLLYFMLSELSLHPRKTGGADMAKAREYVDEIALAHPWRLFDSQLPAEVLQHCADVWLSPYTELLTVQSQSNQPPCWENEDFLYAVPRLLPSLHALLNWRATNPTSSEKYVQCEYRLKLLLQAFQPHFFTDREEKLPDHSSLLGKICFRLIPQLIEYFMQADTILRKAMRSLSGEESALDSEAVKIMQKALCEQRNRLFELAMKEISQLLSFRPYDNKPPPTEKQAETCLQNEEARIKHSLVGHALNWPGVILESEANRLRHRLKPEERHGMAMSSQAKAIEVLNRGRFCIDNLNHQYLSLNLPPRNYVDQVKDVLSEVERDGSRHHHAVTIACRAAANVLIALSAGLLYVLLKPLIKESQVGQATGLKQYFFSLDSRRGATLRHLSVAHAKSSVSCA